jgi:ubiquinone biosynthesis protein COQ9
MPLSDAVPPPGAPPYAGRDAILEATLDHVAFEGWTRKALVGGLADLGLPPAAGELAFPGGMADMIRHWSASLDSQMTEAMATTDQTGMQLPDRLAEAIRIRLALCEPHREAVRRAIAYLALPPHQAVAPRLTYATVDAIWYAAGDRSTDFSFYTKRASLAGIYAATVLFWLDDTSEDGEATRAFLARRLGEFGWLYGLRRRAAARLEGLTRPFAGLWARRADG